MTSTHRILPHPFKPLKSFLSYAVGEEKIVIKPEWQRAYEPSRQAAEPRKDAA